MKDFFSRLVVLSMLCNFFSLSLYNHFTNTNCEIVSLITFGKCCDIYYPSEGGITLFILSFFHLQWRKGNDFPLGFLWVFCSLFFFNKIK